MKTIAVVDGAYLDCVIKSLDAFTCARNVKLLVDKCLHKDENLFRVYYCHARPYSGPIDLPVSNHSKHWSEKSNPYLDNVSELPNFKLQLGSLMFRGWQRRDKKDDSGETVDADFYPVFEQKCVDMMLGLAIVGAKRQGADHVMVITTDQDLIPAIDEATYLGMQVSLVKYSNATLNPDLKRSVDFIREVQLPEVGNDASDPEKLQPYIKGYR